MKEIIEMWAKPTILQKDSIKFVFNSNEIITTINSLKNGYYSNLHCEDGSVKFCLYDFESDKILFTMDFFEPKGLRKGEHIKLNILYVNDFKLRSKGIATYYMKKLVEYSTERNIPCIKLFVNPNDKLFIDKRNALSKEELKRFYKSMSTNKVKIKYCE